MSRRDRFTLNPTRNANENFKGNMNILATRLARAHISASATSAQRTRELRAAGHDIIGLSQGEPDFDTPEHVIEAAYNAMRAGQTRYTPVDGTPELKQAIIDKFGRENG